MPNLPVPARSYPAQDLRSAERIRIVYSEEDLRKAVTLALSGKAELSQVELGADIFLSRPLSLPTGLAGLVLSGGGRFGLFAGSTSVQSVFTALSDGWSGSVTVSNCVLGTKVSGYNVLYLFDGTTASAQSIAGVRLDNVVLHNVASLYRSTGTNPPVLSGLTFINVSVDNDDSSTFSWSDAPATTSDSVFIHCDGITPVAWSNGGYNTYRKQVTATTTDGSTTTVMLVPTRTNKGYSFEIDIIGRQTNGANQTNVYKYVVKLRNNAGVLSGGISNIVVNEDVGAWNATASTSGTNLAIQVVGAAATNITWLITCQTTEV